MTEDLELRILRVPIEGWPTLTFHHGMYRAEKDYQEMIDSGENIRVSLWYGTLEEPLKKWERDGR